MKFETIFDKPPVGYVSEFKPKGKQGNLKIQTSGFFTNSDGDKLVTLLNGISDCYLSILPPDKKIYESQIDSLLAIIDRNNKCVLYINEIKLIASIIVNKGINAGQAVYQNDIADILRVTIENITIPNDCGFALVLSAGWRKALFFDYGPINPKNQMNRNFNYEFALAEVLAYISLYEKISLTELQWDEIFKQCWFPFSILSVDDIRLMKAYVDNNYPIDDLIDDFKAEMLKHCSEIKKAINKSEMLTEHNKILTQCIVHFENADYISCSGLLYPRIEGVLRTWHSFIGSKKKITQDTLKDSIGTNIKGELIISGLLFAPKFQKFLKEVYFANFDPNNPSNVSRNSVSHGVVPQDRLDIKAALLGIMILEQIMYLMTAGNATLNVKPDLNNFIQQEIQKQAYFNYLGRNNSVSDPLTDWLVAEKQVKSKYGIKS